MCRTQLHSVWTRCVSKFFVIPVFEVFDCKRLMSHVSGSVAFSLRQMSIGGALKKESALHFPPNPFPVSSTND